MTEGRSKRGREEEWRRCARALRARRRTFVLQQRAEWQRVCVCTLGSRGASYQRWQRAGGASVARGSLLGAGDVCCGVQHSHGTTCLWLDGMAPNHQREPVNLFTTVREPALAARVRVSAGLNANSLSLSPSLSLSLSRSGCWCRCWLRGVCLLRVRRRSTRASHPCLLCPIAVHSTVAMRHRLRCCCCRRCWCRCCIGGCIGLAAAVAAAAGGARDGRSRRGRRPPGRCPALITQQR
jgi:hypothetical protein